MPSERARSAAIVYVIELPPPMSAASLGAPGAGVVGTASWHVARTEGFVFGAPAKSSVENVPTSIVPLMIVTPASSVHVRSCVHPSCVNVRSLIVFQSFSSHGPETTVVEITSVEEKSSCSIEGGGGDERREEKEKRTISCLSRCARGILIFYSHN